MRNDRDIFILEHIVKYCDEIEIAMDRFGRDYDVFQNDSVYKNALAMCILQIGELSAKLSTDFKISHTAIPWVQIKATRNIVAHRYGSIDPIVLWETVMEDIPALKKYCEALVYS